MNLETANQFTESYFSKLEDWGTWLQWTWTNEFLEATIKSPVPGIYFLSVVNIEITEMLILYLQIPESESDYHKILSILKIQ